MRKILIIFWLLITFFAKAQVYNPSNFTVSNKPYGSAQAFSTDARSLFYDASNFVWRDYNGTAEVLTYLNLAKYRFGHFPIYVHSGGSLSGGVWTGGVSLVFFFKNGTADSNLVRWYTDSIPSGGGITQLTGDVIAGPGSGSVAASLAIVNSNTGTFGNAANVLQANFDGKGRALSVANIPIQIAEAQVTNLTTDLANKLSNITGLIQQGTNITITGSGTVGSPYVINSTGGGGADSAVNPGLWLSQTIVGTTKTLNADSALMAAYFLRRSDSIIDYVTPTQLANSTPTFEKVLVAGSTLLTDHFVDATNHQFNFDSVSFFGITSKINAGNQGTFAFQPNQNILRTLGGSNTTVSEVGTFVDNPFGDGTTNGINLRADNGIVASRINVSERYIHFISDTVKLGGWGTGTHLGLRAYPLAITSNGTIIEDTTTSGGGGGISTLNTLTAATQTFATGTSGSDFGIVSSGSTHTFNIPDGSGSARGLLTIANFNTFNGKLSDPLTTNGDIIARISGSTTRLAQGSNNTFLGVQSGTLGYYAPFSLTTTGSSGAATFVAGVLNIPQYSGGGGSQTLQQVLTTGSTLTQANTINNGGFRQTSTGGLNLFDSVAISLSLVRSDSTVAFDNSIGAGTGASSATYRYLYLLSSKLRTFLSDYSVGGTTMQVDGLAKIPLIPTYNVNVHRWLVIGYLENDIINAGNNATWDTAHCGPIYRQFVDTAIARGWPASHILLRGPVWVSPTNYVNATLVRQAQYQAMVASIAAARSTKYVALFDAFVNRGTSILMFDQVLHPNNTGHSFIANLAYIAMGGDSARSNGGQGIINNRITDINRLFYQGQDTLSYRAVVLGVDTNGKVGRMSADQVILNSQILPQAQASSINLTGTGSFGNGTNTAMPASVSLFTPGAIQGGLIRATTAAPAGLTGASMEIAYISGVGYIYAYDRTGGVAKDVSFSSLGGHSMFNTATLTGGPEVVQINGGMSANFGRFQNNITGTGLTGPATEVGFNTGSDYSFIYGYNRTTAAGKNFVVGAGLSPIVAIGSATFTGSSLLQVNGSGYVSGKFGINVSAPTALLNVGGNITSPTVGRKGGYFSSDTAIVTYNVDIPIAIDHFFGRKTIDQTTAHTIQNNYNVWIEKDTARFNSTIVRNRSLFVAGASKFMDSILIGNLQTGTSGDSVLVWNSTDSAIKKVAQSSIGGGGTPGGSNTQVQFNNSGAFGGSANLTWASNTLTATNMAITTLTQAGANDSTLTWDPVTKQIKMRYGIFTLKVANGITASSGQDSLYGFSGTLMQNSTVGGGNFSLALGTSGSKLSNFSIWSSGGVSLTGGQYASSGGSQLLEVASTINNPITAASGTVTNFSAYFFQTPTVTSTNASVTYSNPATFRIENSPTMSTNSSASGVSYSLDVAAGVSHFGVGASNISALFDGVVAMNGVSGNTTVGLGLGASTSGRATLNIGIGVDPSSGSINVTSGNMWYNGTNFYFVDGSGTGVARDLLAGVSNYTHTITTPSTGGTVNLVKNQYNIINPSGTIATLTVNLPSSPNNNDVVYIKITQVISAVTYGNGTVVDGISAPAAGSLIVLTFDSGTNSWY